MIIGSFIQQPDDVLDYDVGFHKWIDLRDDFIVDILIDIVPNTGDLNVAHVLAAPSERPTEAKLWVQGGIDGESYTIEITGVMDSGRTKQVELICSITDF